MSLDPIAAEFREVQLGDKRLESRVGWFVTKLAQRPNQGLPTVLGDDAGLEAGYRLMSNDRVDFDAVVAPHSLATALRAASARRVIVAHDTTQFSFANRGFGPLRGTGGGDGFYMHCALVLADDGTRDPLGVIAAKTFERDERPRGVRKTKQERRLSSEHDHWLESVELAAERLGNLSAVHVMDRFADSYRLFVAMKDLASFVVRGRDDRRITLPDESRRLLVDVLREQPTTLTREVHVSARAKGGWNERRHLPPRDSRETQLHAAACEVTLDKPTSAPRGSPRTVTLNAVQVREAQTPEGDDPIEWLLYTNLPIDTPEEVAAIIDAYRGRWVIEEFFKAIKTGCAYEARQLETRHALLNMLALTIPVAWRLLRLRQHARAQSSPPARLVLPRTQLEVLAATARAQLPKNPTARDALLAVARLGGHLKRNGEPGWQVLKRGYDELLLLERGWRLARGLSEDPAEM